MRQVGLAVRYQVLLWLSLAAMIVYWQRTVIAVPEKTIRAELGLSTDEMGQVMAAFALAYTLFQIPTGHLGDVWGARRLVPWCVALSSLATASMIGAQGFWGLCVGRFGLGAAQAGLFPASVGAFRRWFPEDQRALPSGWLTAFMSLGTIAGTALCGWLLTHVAWRTAVFVAAIPGVAWAAGFRLWYRDDPAEHSAVSPAELRRITGHLAPTHASVGSVPGAVPWPRLFASGRLWCLSAQHFFRAAAYMFFQTWFPTFLQESRGADLAASGYLTGIPVAGVVLGSLAGGSLSDALLARSGSLRVARQGLAIAGLLACAATFVAAYFLRDAWATVCLLGIGALAFGVSSPVAYTLSIDLGGRHAASVFSVMNAAGNLGGLLTPLVVPRLVEQGGGWHALPLWFAGMYALAALAFAPLDPRGAIVPGDS